MRIDVNNISHAALMRIAPKVEQLAGRDIPADMPGQQLDSPDLDTFRSIKSELFEYQPPINGATLIQSRNAITAARMQRIENGGGFTGFSGAKLHDDGSFTVFNSKAEAVEDMRQWQQSLIERLMDAINAMRATNPQPPTVGVGLDIQT